MTASGITSWRSPTRAVTEFGTALYLDGVRYSVNTNKPALTASTKNLFIGENPEALNRQWTGEIDDIGIWNRVLTSADVSTLYNGGARDADQHSARSECADVVTRAGLSVQ